MDVARTIQTGVPVLEPCYPLDAGADGLNSELPRHGSRFWIIVLRDMREQHENIPLRPTVFKGSLQTVTSPSLDLRKF